MCLSQVAVRGQGSDRQMAWVPRPPPVTRTTTGRGQQVPGSLLWKEKNASQRCRCCLWMEDSGGCRRGEEPGLKPRS